jgi:hypothetical protein
LVAVPPFDDGGDIDIDDVAIAEFVLAGDAMADDVIDAGATALGIPLVAECGGAIAVLERPLVSELVDLFGGDAGGDERAEVVQQRGVSSSCGPHQIALGVIENRRLRFHRRDRERSFNFKTRPAFGERFRRSVQGWIALG